MSGSGAGPILLTGATGTVGRELTAALLERDHQIRAVVQDPVKVDALAARGIDVRRGSFENIGFLRQALAGVERLFLLTPPGTDVMVRRQCTVVDVAVEAGVRHIVKQSSIAADEVTRAGILRAHGEIEDYIEASGLAWTHLRPNWLMQNGLGQAGSITADGELRAPDIGRITTIDARDIAGVASRVLTEDRHEGKAYVLTGPEPLSYADIAEIYSTVLGRPIRWVEVTLDDAEEVMESSGLAPELAHATAEILARFREGGVTATVSADAPRVLGREARSFEQFARDNRPGLQALLGKAG